MENITRSSLRLIHLDLKTCPLKIQYLEQLFGAFTKWGGNGLLIEWEDTFPYSDELIDIGSEGKAAYTSVEVQQILRIAKDFNIIVIPLVQTFGHLEFVLKTSKWRYLREVPKYCSSLCPSNPNSYHLITSMIVQIMNSHNESKFLHIGGDEVWHLGLCNTCRAEEKYHLFLKHIVKVTKFIQQRYPQITIIMWDDMLREMDINLLKEFQLNDLIEPMIWEYRNSDIFALSPELWNKYGEVFDKVWIASAFKGATGSCQILPIVKNHISNHEKWLEVVTNNASRFKCFRGIAFTGWSRYDHYATLCELMPAGLPSLALCLKTWLNGKFSEDVYQQVSGSLGFTKEAPLNLCSDVNRPIKMPMEFNFPSGKIYVGIEWFANVRSKFNFIATGDQCMTWLNSWHVKRNYTSIMQIEHIFVNLRELFRELQAVEKYLRSHMSEAFYDHTIEEWLGCYVEPLRDDLLRLLSMTESQLGLEL